MIYVHLKFHHIFFPFHLSFSRYMFSTKFIIFLFTSNFVRFSSYFIRVSSDICSLKIHHIFSGFSSLPISSFFFIFHLIFFRLCLSQILSCFLKIYIHFKFPHIFLLIHKCSSDLCSLPISLNFIQISSDFYIFFVLPQFSSVFLFRQIFF